ncbi:MAG: archease [Candidatus Methylomirabilis oxyfera]|nr:archease [Candidatus Methylomirabilis oxyfera]
MSDQGFELFETTADVGIMAWGETLEELFANAARGMFALMVDPATVRSTGRLSIEARGGDLPSLLVAWLNELLDRCEAEAWAPSEVRVAAIGGGRASGELAGEPAEAGRHRFRGVVKAATYHLLNCQKDGDRWRAKVVFDV